MLFTSLSRIQQDTAHLRKAFLSVLELVAVLLFPLCAGMAVAAPQLVLVVLGSQWTLVAGLVPWFALAGGCAVVSRFSQSVAEARADLNRSMGVHVIYLVVLASCLALALQFRSRGVWVFAAAVAAGEMLRHLGYLALMRRLVGLEASQVVRSYAPAAFASAGVAVTIAAVQRALAGSLPSLLALAAEIAAGALALARWAPLAGCAGGSRRSCLARTIRPWSRSRDHDRAAGPRSRAADRGSLRRRAAGGPPLPAAAALAPAARDRAAGLAAPRHADDQPAGEHQRLPPVPPVRRASPVLRDLPALGMAVGPDRPDLAGGGGRHGGAGDVALAGRVRRGPSRRPRREVRQRHRHPGDRRPVHLLPGDRRGPHAARLGTARAAGAQAAMAQHAAVAVRDAAGPAHGLAGDAGRRGGAAAAQPQVRPPGAGDAGRRRDRHLAGVRRLPGERQRPGAAGQVGDQHRHAHLARRRLVGAALELVGEPRQLARRPAVRQRLRAARRGVASGLPPAQFLHRDDAAERGRRPARADRLDRRAAARPLAAGAGERGPRAVRAGRPARPCGHAARLVHHLGARVRAGHRHRTRPGPGGHPGESSEPRPGQGAPARRPGDRRGPGRGPGGARRGPGGVGLGGAGAARARRRGAAVTPPPPASRPDRPGPAVRRRRRAVVTFAVTVVLLAALGAGLAWQARSPAPPDPAGARQARDLARMPDPPPAPVLPCVGVPVGLGDDLQRAVDAHPAGTSFCLAAGVHRLAHALPKDGQRFVGEGRGTVLRGAKVLRAADARQHGPGRWHWDGQTQRSEPHGELIGPGHAEAPNPGDRYNEELFVTASGDPADPPRRHRRVLTLAELGHGRWYFDEAADRIYLADDPARLGLIETSVTPAALPAPPGTHPHGVVVENLVVEKYASPAQQAAVGGEGGSDWTLRDVTIRSNHGAGAE